MTIQHPAANGEPVVDADLKKQEGVTMELVGDEARLIDPEVERRVVRRIDLFFMPAMVIGTCQLSQNSS